MADNNREEMLDFGQDFEQQNVENQTGAKKPGKGAKIVSWVLVAALGLGAIGGAAYGLNELNKHMAHKKTVKSVTSIVQKYEGPNNFVSLDETIYTTGNYDTKICNGQVLVDVLNEQGIKYCEVLDEYYTNDGRDIAIVTVEVTRDLWVDPEVINDEVKGSEFTYYTLPEGYVLKNGRGYKQVVETKEVVTEVRKDNDYSKITISGIEGKITKVGEPTIVKTKSFKDIVASELVCDVKDDYAATKNGNLSEATYRLIPKQ
jgi:hypothetical protein